jgi:hypothetical protein
MNYRQLNQDEYLDKLKGYFQKQANVLLFLRFIITMDYPKGRQMNEFWIKALFDIHVYGEFESRSESIVMSALPETERRLFEVYSENKEVIKELLRADH